VIIATIKQGILTELQNTFERPPKAATHTNQALPAEMKEMLDAEFVLNKKLAR